MSSSSSSQDASAKHEEEYQKLLQKLSEVKVQLETYQSALEGSKTALEGDRAAFEKEKETMDKIKAKQTDIIKLNVGGRPFATSRATLCAQPDTLLASMFSGRWEQSIQRDDTGAAFLDFDPDLFALLLNHLRDLQISPHPSPPPTVSPEKRKAWETMLTYFGFLQQSSAAAALGGGYVFGRDCSDSRYEISKEGKQAKMTANVSNDAFAKTEQVCDPSNTTAYSCSLRLSGTTKFDCLDLGILLEGGTEYKQGYVFGNKHTYAIGPSSSTPSELFSHNDTVVLTLQQSVLTLKNIRTGVETSIRDIDTTKRYRFAFGCREQGGTVEIL